MLHVHPQKLNVPLLYGGYRSKRTDWANSTFDLGAWPAAFRGDPAQRTGLAPLGQAPRLTDNKSCLDVSLYANAKETALAVEAAIDRLARLSPPKKWLSTAALARTMGMDLDTAFDTLRAESDKPDRKIRYSALPSRRTLDVLWGHVDVVGERRLHPLERGALPESFTTPDRPVAEDSDDPVLFLSHSMQDFPRVQSLRDRLEAEGYRVWIFEDDMQTGEIVHHAIRRSLENSEAFGAYFSESYLTSVYSEKEMLQLESHDKEEIIFFNDESRPFYDLAASCLEATNDFESEQIEAFLEMRGLNNFSHRGLLRYYLGLIQHPGTQRVIDEAASPNWMQDITTSSNRFLKLDVI